VTQEEADYLTELVRTAARRALPTEQYIIMTDENIYELLPPEKRDLSQCEGQCEVETGRLIGADYIVYGDVVRFGGEPRMTLKLYETAQGNLLESREASGRTVLDVETPAKNAAQILFSVLPGARISSRPTPEPGGTVPVYQGRTADEWLRRGTAIRTGGIATVCVGGGGGLLLVTILAATASDGSISQTENSMFFVSLGVAGASILVGAPLWAVGQADMNRGRKMQKGAAWMDVHRPVFGGGFDPHTGSTSFALRFAW
jgi:hypothetical protein